MMEMVPSKMEQRSAVARPFRIQKPFHGGSGGGCDRDVQSLFRGRRRDMSSDEEEGSPNRSKSWSPNNRSSSRRFFERFKTVQSALNAASSLVLIQKTRNHPIEASFGRLVGSQNDVDDDHRMSRSTQRSSASASGASVHADDSSGKNQFRDFSGMTIEFDDRPDRSSKHQQQYRPQPPPVDVLLTKSLSVTKRKSPRRNSRDALYQTHSMPTVIRRRNRGRNSSDLSSHRPKTAEHTQSLRSSRASSDEEPWYEHSPASPSAAFMKKLSTSRFFTSPKTSRVSSLSFSLSSPSIVSMASPSMLMATSPSTSPTKTYSISSIVGNATSMAITSSKTSPQPTLATVPSTHATSLSNLSLESSSLTSPTYQKFTSYSNSIEIMAPGSMLISTPESILKKVDGGAAGIEPYQSIIAGMNLIHDFGDYNVISPSKKLMCSLSRLPPLSEQVSVSSSDKTEELEYKKGAIERELMSRRIAKDLTPRQRWHGTMEVELDDPPNGKRGRRSSLDLPPRSPRRSLSNEPREDHDMDSSDSSDSSQTSHSSQSISIHERRFRRRDDPFDKCQSLDSISYSEDPSPNIVATPRPIFDDDQFSQTEIIIPLAPPSSRSSKKDVPVVRPTRIPSREGSASSRGTDADKNRRCHGLKELLQFLHTSSLFSPERRINKSVTDLPPSPKAYSSPRRASDPPRPPQRKKSDDNLTSPSRTKPVSKSPTQPPNLKRSNNDLVSPNTSPVSPKNTKSLEKIPSVIISTRSAVPISPLATYSHHVTAMQWAEIDPLPLDGVATVDRTGKYDQRYCHQHQRNTATTTKSSSNISVDRWGEICQLPQYPSTSIHVETNEGMKTSISPLVDRWE